MHEDVKKDVIHVSLRDIKNSVCYSLGLYRFMDFYEVYGITSRVINDSGDIGHVLLADADNSLLDEIVTECKKHFTVFYVLESSDSSYHVINPVVRTFEYTNDILESLSFEDYNHRDTGYNRGKWVLRTSKKHNKPEPKIIYSRFSTNGSCLSRPHMEYLKQIHGVKVLHTDLTVAGENLEFEKYWTFR